MAIIDTTARRRTKVKGHPGVYHRQVGRRRKYEVTFVDETGRRRWRTVDGFDNLDTADTLLADITGKRRRGERVAPSKTLMGDAVAEWLDGKNIAERTRERYESNVRLYILKKWEHRLVQDITVDDVAGLLAEMRKNGLAEWTLSNVKTTLSGFFVWACSPRRGYAPVNPVSQLDADERPKPRSNATRRTFQPAEITALLESATSDRYRTVLATAIFTGLRLQELLGLRWQDVDFDAAEIRVRCQVTRKGGRLEKVKTAAGDRDVTLRPELARLLKKHRMRSRYKQPGDFVLASETGGPLGWRNVERRAMDAAYEAAVKAGRLSADRPKPVMHHCRHTFGSMLVREGSDIYSVKRQMGHAKASTTLDIYTGEFDRRGPNEHPNYGHLLRDLGNPLESAPSGGAKLDAPDSVEESGFGG